MRIIGVIPSRYESSRFPGKPLADIMGKTMIQRVYEQCLKAKSLDEVVVATDDQRIYDHVLEFGGKVIMTAADHQSGTDRCGEIANAYPNAHIFINIQGDEPFIAPEQINALADFMDENAYIQIGTLARVITDMELITNPNVVKAVVNLKNEALYFSRSIIPHPRRADLANHYQHIGIYAYRSDVLENIVKLPVSNLEKTESLEQLRWLDNGYRVGIELTEHESHGVDTPEQLKELIKKME